MQLKMNDQNSMYLFTFLNKYQLHPTVLLFLNLYHAHLFVREVSY